MIGSSNFVCHSISLARYNMKRNASVTKCENLHFAQPLPRVPRNKHKAAGQFPREPYTLLLRLNILTLLLIILDFGSGGVCTVGKKAL